ncbi:C4-dicarboxylate TRAP transporter substrate-binding protein [Denitrobaculum tricleocarpae]|uniref:C4-dicarboxylate ABC transporter substrate-binding protein n=1 Tax=Denitrobaculum tricleocarpae TaxID=2591009 RepID=A0A545SZ79_9PROT|nr:C4-dicarboxylate TRAP transporter substrate-binding protein [Denitrobaculum tricleocarpae]TQV70276.1 C4-dicarboxylate ABC transporter substrate-binding protein [Denitrobaculum tricleocarpae]
MIRFSWKTAALAGLAITFAGAEVMAATTWNASLWGKRRAFTEHMEKLSELVAQKSNGEFQIKLHYGAALSKNRENLDGISIGAFEMAQFCAGYHRDKNPTITVLELPFLGVTTLEQEIKLSNAVYSHPATQKDLARWNAKLLMPSPMPQYNVAGTGAAPTSLADFDGMRIRATGGIGQAFKTVGAVPTSVTSSEAYNALESGVVDSVAFAPHAHLAFRTVDIAKWWTTNLNPGTVNCPIVANIDSFEALSDENKEILMSSIPEALDHYLAKYGEVYDKWGPVLEENGVQKIDFPQAEIDAFRESAATPAREAWIKDMEAKGVPAQELYDLVVKTLNE